MHNLSLCPYSCFRQMSPSISSFCSCEWLFALSSPLSNQPLYTAVAIYTRTQKNSDLQINCFERKDNLVTSANNGSTKAIDWFKTIITITIINDLSTYLQQCSHYWVRQIRICTVKNSIDSLICSSWTLILFETLKRVVSYRSLNDFRDCYGLWNAIEVPLKICQTAAFLEVNLIVYQTFNDVFP